MAKQRGTSADRKNGIVSPLFLSLFSLSLIILLFFYVMNTLESSLNGSIEKGLDVTYAQFVQRERVLAREEVEKFIETLKSVAPDRTGPWKRIKRT